MSNLTTDAICAQIDAIQKTANRLVDGVCQQRDEAREVLQAIAYCLELSDDSPHGVQVKEGRGEDFWRTLYELKRAYP